MLRNPARLFLLCVSVLNGISALAQSASSNLVLWDKKPASAWMTEAYPMGNGHFGGMVYGGLNQEHIQFNELSLWTGDESNTGAYQAFGDLYISLGGSDSLTAVPENYRRELDLRRSVQQITYNNNGINYKREYFCSFPDKMMVLQFTANKKAAYSAIIKLKDAHGMAITGAFAGLNFAGKLQNGMAYQASINVKAQGGKVTLEKDTNGEPQLKVSNADGFTILLAAATDYSNKRSQQWKGESPSSKIKKSMAAAALKTYQQLYNNHVKDYQSLFSTVNLTLGTTPPEVLALPTNQRLISYKRTTDPHLETLLFQFGRYLLISSSRKGGLPANLQGMWNESNDPPWRCDYHSNINIQMNYWPAEPANLSECAFPYLDYINSMREVKKESTQKEYPGVRGWTVRTENNIFGGSSFTWNTPGSAWYMQAIWEHYAFTQNKQYLKDFAYPILKEVVNFWDDHLKRRPDGTLVSPMGWSPEHGPTEDGVTYDQEIVYDLFTNYIEAADVLKIDKEYRDHVADLREHLLKPKIGKWGQLQEWETDRDDPNDKHRHSSNLFGLHPGRRISTVNTPDLARAAKVSLAARGDESTGWSMAWKMNFWARLQDGEHAYTILKNFITLVGGSGINYSEGGGLYSNLFCAHPPFQIDGNFGYTAGVAEMLIQSQAGQIQLLPALPGAWSSGAAEGLIARGGFQIKTMVWKNGRIVKLVIRSLAGKPCIVRSPNALSSTFKATVGKENVYSFTTKAGGDYAFTGM